MKTLTLTLLLALALSFACDKAKISNADKPLSVPGEKTYALAGKIVGRDAAENALTIDHKAIPGYMEAMTMDYIVRGAKVEALPPNGIPITATLHVTRYKGMWITDLRPDERLYSLEGTIVGRDLSDNSLKIDHKKIPGFTEETTLEYVVLGAKVEDLPPNGVEIEATIHVTEIGIWITDVRAGDAAHRPPQSPAAQPPAASR